MNRFWKLLNVVAASATIAAQAASAQTLVNTWSFTGGSLDPDTYGGAFQPATLIPDAANSNGATIAESYSSAAGGLGSATTPKYGGIYTSFSGMTFTMTATTILDDLDRITFSMMASAGGPPFSFGISTLTLNYNGANSAVAANNFLAGTPVIIGTPIGPQEVTPYTWTWSGLDMLGTTTEFSTGLSTGATQHMFIDSISVVQAVPEPATVGLMALGGALLALRRKHRFSLPS